MSTAQLSSKKIVTLASAPTPGQNTNALVCVGSSLFYDNGTALVPLDLQGDWAGRTVTDADATSIASPSPDNVVYMSSTAAHSYTLGTGFALNKMIDVVQLGTAAVTVLAASGVTLVGPYVVSNAISTKYAGQVLTFIQRGTNTWQVIGGAPLACPVVSWKGFSSNTVNIGAGAFTNISLSELYNVGGGYFAYGVTYVAPYTGLYQTVGALRIQDNAAPINVGIGINSYSGDSSDFYWSTNASPSTGTPRWTFQYGNQMLFYASDQIRLFTYVDSSGGANIVAAMMAIKLLELR